MKRFPLLRRAVLAAAPLLCALIPALVIFAGGDGRAAAFSAVPTVLLLACLLILDGLHRKYTDDVLESLTLLIESLVNAQAEAPFPEDEDTLLSRLQNQLLKLREILKAHLTLLEREKGQIQSFISDAAHQIKTPLAAARAYAELLKDPDLTPEMRSRHLNTLEDSLDRLTLLTEGLVKISRLESGLIQLRPQPVLPGDLILHALKPVAPRVQEKRLHCSYDPCPAVPVRADPVWTVEAIVNILDNAVKYTPSGGSLSIRSAELPSYLRLDFFSSSPPIPPEERSRIFQRFYRGSQTGPAEGVGIGLYLVREIAVRQEGMIRLTPGPDGNTFSLFLRRAEASESNPQPT